LPLDHLASKFEYLFWLCRFLKRFSKIFPIEADVGIFYPIVAPLTSGHQKLNKIDSALYQEALM
jgi:hypothetical protein